MNKIFSIILVAAVFFTGCAEFDDHLTENAQIGGLIENESAGFALTPSEAATAVFDITFLALQGTTHTAQYNVYKQFIGVAGTSDKVLLTTITPEAGSLTQRYTFSTNYADLIEGMTAGGSALPADIFAYTVGDRWVLSFESILDDGSVFQNSVSENTTISVSGRYAGDFIALETDYWRINVQSGSADWSGSLRTMESVSPGIYYHKGAFGPFENIFVTSAGNQYWFYFNLDEASGEISYESSYDVEGETVDLTGLGTGIVSCESDLALFDNVPCEGSNIAIPDNTAGKDTLKMTYGYWNASGDEHEGEREFYELLVRN